MVRIPCFHCMGHEWVRSLVRELRSHKPHGLAKTNKQKSIRDPKEDIQMTNTWKDAQHHWSLEKCIKTKMKLWLCIYRMAIRWTVARLARIWRIRSPTHGWWEYKVMQPFWKTFWHILKMLNSVAIWAISLFAISKRVENIHPHKNMCTNVHKM